ncbi:MAG: hypothetical protein ACYC5M_05905 [Anaerolineae bacterium]
MDQVRFHNDESRRIGTSYFLEPFLRGDIHSPVWEESYWTLTQPPLSRYVVGLGRLAGGYTDSMLSGPWEFGVDAAGNAAAGNMPGPHLLWWSRLPMALLAALCGWLLFDLARRCDGLVSGGLAVTLFALNPYLATTLRRAMGEAPLVALALLALRAGVHALAQIDPSNAKRQSTLPLAAGAWLLVAGACAGASGAAKLNGLASGVAVALLPALSCMRHGMRVCRRRIIWALLAAVLVLGATGSVFVALNPYLYPAPVERSLRLYRWRLHEMENQQRGWQQDQISGIRARISTVSQRVLQDYAPMQFRGAWLANLVLGALGLVALMRSAWYWLRGAATSPAPVVLLLVGAATSIPSLLTPLDWDRYYIFPVIFSTLGIAVGLAATVRWVQAGWQAKAHPAQ